MLLLFFDFFQNNKCKLIETKDNLMQTNLFVLIILHYKSLTESAEKSSTVGGNKMDAFNLAMVFGPNLLKKHKIPHASATVKMSDYSADKYSLIDDIDSVISITKYLIESQDSIFFIGSELHNELLQTIDSVSQSEEVNAILVRKIISKMGVTLIKDKSNMSSLATTPVSSVGSADGAKFLYSINATLTKQSNNATSARYIMTN